VSRQKTKPSWKSADKAVGVIATHEEYPIERMRLDRRQKWLGSVSHDEIIKLTDVENMLEDSDDEGEGGEEDDDEMDADADSDAEGGPGGDEAQDEEDEDEEDEDEDEGDSDSDVEMDGGKKSKKEGGKGGMGDMGRTHKKTEEGGFFDDL
jgi:hypothetical protein